VEGVVSRGEGAEGIEKGTYGESMTFWRTTCSRKGRAFSIQRTAMRNWSFFAVREAAGWHERRPRLADLRSGATALRPSDSMKTWRDAGVEKVAYALDSAIVGVKGSVDGRPFVARATEPSPSCGSTEALGVPATDAHCLCRHRLRALD
jgi:hypothetical protein